MSTEENLEVRIERIRKRNEEIQKRHAEAEADKLRAKQANAMVETRGSKFDDWPREHKYDHVEFSFDSSVGDKDWDAPTEQRERRNRKSQGFGEGDGPPPDPVYSFLKDSERDADYGGTDQSKQNRNLPEKQQWGQRGNETTSHRGRGRGRGSQRGRGRFRAGNHDSQRPDYDAWRSERNRIDEARISRQINSEGKWRREWDYEKFNADDNEEGDHLNKPDKATLGDVVKAHSGYKTVESRLVVERSFGGNSSNERDADQQCKEKLHERPNLKLSINPTGELQSVKVISPPVIGSGRVGPRQIKSRPIFSDENEIPEQYNAQQVNFHKELQQNNYFPQHVQVYGDDPRQNPQITHNYQTNSHVRPQQKHGIKMKSTKVSSESRFSIQDRINMIRSPTETEQNQTNVQDKVSVKCPEHFMTISQELENVSVEIQGIYDSVENLNKKRINEYTSNIDCVRPDQTDKITNLEDELNNALKTFGNAENECATLAENHVNLLSCIENITEIAGVDDIKNVKDVDEFEVKGKSELINSEKVHTNQTIDGSNEEVCEEIERVANNETNNGNNKNIVNNEEIKI